MCCRATVFVRSQIASPPRMHIHTPGLCGTAQEVGKNGHTGLWATGCAICRTKSSNERHSRDVALVRNLAVQVPLQRGEEPRQPGQLPQPQLQRQPDGPGRRLPRARDGGNPRHQGWPHAAPCTHSCRTPATSCAQCCPPILVAPLALIDALDLTPSHAPRCPQRHAFACAPERTLVRLCPCHSTPLKPSKPPYKPLTTIKPYKPPLYTRAVRYDAGGGELDV